MDWDDLRFLLSISRCGTLSAAGKRLGVSHSTVGRRLAALEQTLGCKAFERHPDGYVPTEDGQALIAIAERMEEQAFVVDRRIAGRDASLSGRLSVTTIDTLALRQMQLFAGFARRHPGIELQIIVDNIFHNLTRREADIALRASNAPPEHLVGRRLGRLDFALYGSRTLIDEIGADAPLNAYPWLLPAERFDARVTEARKRKHAPSGRVACRVDSSEVLFAALRAGMGIGFAPVLDGALEPDLLQMRPIEPDFGIDLWLLTHSDLRNAARVRAFMDFATEAFSPLRDAMGACALSG